nr:hypothetical protein [Pseudomonas sp. BIGb0427]
MTIALDSFEQTVGLAFASPANAARCSASATGAAAGQAIPRNRQNYPQLRESQEIYLCRREPEAPGTWTIKALAEVFLEKLISQTTFDFTGVALINCFLSFTPRHDPFMTEIRPLAW